MISERYDFLEFLREISGRTRVGIFLAAREEIAAAEGLTRRGRRGSPSARVDGASRYAAELKGLVFFLTHGKRPFGGRQFQAYRPLAVELVERGELSEEVLGEFAASNPEE